MQCVDNTFAGFLGKYVESASAREKLALATARVAKMAAELDLDATTVVSTVELITGSLLQRADELSCGRAERYSEAMTAHSVALQQHMSGNRRR